MTKSQIEKFAVGYSSYPTDCVEREMLLKKYAEPWLENINLMI